MKAVNQSIGEKKFLLAKKEERVTRTKKYREQLDAYSSWPNQNNHIQPITKKEAQRTNQKTRLKHVTRAERGKTRNRCQARENAR